MNDLTNRLFTASVEQDVRRIGVRVTGPAGVPGFWTAVEDDGTHHTLHYSQLMPMSSVPARYKKSQFDKYAPALGAALTAYPNAVRVPCGSYSVETIARCLREARDAKLSLDYTHPSIDEVLFARHGRELKTGMRKDYVLLGPRESITPLSKALEIAFEQPVQAVTATVEVKPSPDALERICWLLSNRTLDPPPSFVIRFPQRTETEIQTIIDSYEVRYDIVFAQSKESPDLYYIT